MARSVMYHSFPLGRNKILARFTNLADRFDKALAEQKNYVDIDKWAVEFYKDANPQLAPAGLGALNMLVEEVSLSNNQLESQLEADRFNWVGIDDPMASQHRMEAPAAEGPHSRALEHQRIRQFVITYSPAPAALAEGTLSASNGAEKSSIEQKPSDEAGKGPMI